MTKRFKFNGGNNCIEYDGKSILLDSYGEDIEELLNELHEENQKCKEYNGILYANNTKTDRELVKQITELTEENKQLKKQLDSEHQMLENAILLERTRMGQNALKQYKEAIQ